MYNGISSASQFPVVYCLYVLLFKQIGKMIGSLQYAIALYSFVQIIVVSLLTLRLLKWIWKKNIPSFIKWAVFLFFLLNPLVCMYAIEMYKDPVFSLCLAEMCTYLWDIIFESHEIKEINNKFFLLDSLLIIFLRNNGIYIIIALLVILYITQRKRKDVSILLNKLLVLSLTTLILLNNLSSMFAGEQLFQEKIAIPLQQVCAVITTDGNITEEDLEFIKNIVPIDVVKEKFTPYQVDSIKWSSKFNRDFLNQNKMAFLQMWFRTVCKNPKISFTVWMQETFSYWSPMVIKETESNDLSFSIWNLNDNYWLYDYLGERGIEQTSLIKGNLYILLDSFYHLGLKNMYHGLRFWIVLMTAVLSLLIKKDRRTLIFYLPTMLLWGTIMVSLPVAFCARYGLVFLYMLPIYIAMLFEKKHEIEIE